MVQPSNVWTQLSSPLSPQGSVPYVSSDGVSITTDVLHLSYADINATLSGSITPYQLSVWGGIRLGYVDTTGSGSSGPSTNNSPAGKFLVASGVSNKTVISSYCFANSVVLLVLMGGSSVPAYTVSASTGSFQIIFASSTITGLTFAFAIINVNPSGP